MFLIDYIVFMFFFDMIGFVMIGLSSFYMVGVCCFGLVVYYLFGEVLKDVKIGLYVFFVKIGCGYGMYFVLVVGLFGYLFDDFWLL